MELERASGYLAQLQPGDLVVHLKYGIGRYLGLTQLPAPVSSAANSHKNDYYTAAADNPNSNEYLLIEYAQGDKLYLPVVDLDLISPCPGMQHTPLDNLGNQRNWLKRKRQLQQQLQDTAAQLLATFAKRQIVRTAPLTLPPERYADFAAQFPYSLTSAQQQAIDDIISDLQSGFLMDRLICGDVGFGKTEVALRAIFIAIANGFQVALLVPTTLLGQQHLASFQQRLNGFQMRVAFLCADQNRQQQQQIRRQLASGQIDLLIATHKLLQPGLQFAKLKLLVIDEEHRFGVRQKELINQLSGQVHLLSLSATPIPRTLQLALSNLRKMSIIATPPLRRQSVQTIIQPYNPALIKRAIDAELARGGQVYYLHNRVEELAYVTKTLQKQWPKHRIAAVHGQMEDITSARIMSQFRDGQLDILVCTTIIESGIDIPKANTIIITRADLLGLAQLHQLRGRVGRSQLQGFAYLLLPAEAAPLGKQAVSKSSHNNSSKNSKRPASTAPALITNQAQQRLQAILAMQDLGSGYHLALQDLSIRGVGEFLGDKQSGLINGIGFALYQTLMTRAIELLQKGEALDLEQLERQHSKIVEISSLPAFIPTDYLDDVSLRLMLYKQLSECNTLAKLHALSLELCDRLGPFPPPLTNLLILKELNLRAPQLHIQHIHLTKQGLQVEFITPVPYNPLSITAYWQKQGITLQFKPHDTLLILLDLGHCQTSSLLNYLLAWFDELAGSTKKHESA